MSLTLFYWLTIALLTNRLPAWKTNYFKNQFFFSFLKSKNFMSNSFSLVNKQTSFLSLQVNKNIKLGKISQNLIFFLLFLSLLIHSFFLSIFPTFLLLFSVKESKLEMASISSEAKSIYIYIYIHSFNQPTAKQEVQRSCSNRGVSNGGLPVIVQMGCGQLMVFGLFTSQSRNLLQLGC